MTIVVLLIAVLAVRVVTFTPANVTLTSIHSASVQLSGPAPNPTWPESGQAALVVEDVGSAGTSGGDTPIPIASVAKVMTAYLTLEKYPLSAGDGGFALTVTPSEARAEADDVGQDESVVPVFAGERLDERQLLEALLIRSGDNIAQILAAHDAGTPDRFVAEMNAEARALGMTHTTYTDPSGLDPSTVSTAADQVRLLERAITLPVFRQIVTMSSVTLPGAGTVANYNPLISEGYYGKTGSDSEAEGCLAFFKYLTVAGRRLTMVGVVLGQGEGSATSVILGAAGSAARALVDSVSPAIHADTVLGADSAVIRARAANGHSLDAVNARALGVIGWGGQAERLTVGTRRVSSSLRAGQAIGHVALAGALPTAPGSPRQTPVKAPTALPAPGLLWRLAHLF